MTIAELRSEIATAATRNDSAYGARFMLQQKFSLPMTCPILALIALALGASNRKDGKLASFAVGMGVIFVYYVLLWGARAAAMGGRFSPELAPWLPEYRDGHAGAGDVRVARAFGRSANPIQRAGVLAPGQPRRSPESPHRRLPQARPPTTA